MTELLNAEFEDETGATRRLTRDEILGYVGLLAGGRQRDHDPAHRLDRQGAGRAPRPAPSSWSTTRRLVPNAIEELLRYEAPSPVQARYVTQDVEHHGQIGARGQRHGAAQRLGATATSASSPTPTASTSTARSTTT